MLPQLVQAQKTKEDLYHVRIHVPVYLSNLEACVVKREALRRKVSSVGVIVPLEISTSVFSNSHIDLVDVLGHGGRPEVLLVGLGHVERELFVLVGVLMYCKWARERWEGERGGHVWLARTWRACRGSSRGRRGRLCAPPTRVLGSHFGGMEGMRDMVAGMSRSS